MSAGGGTVNKREMLVSIGGSFYTGDATRDGRGRERGDICDSGGVGHVVDSVVEREYVIEESSVGGGEKEIPLN